MQYQFTTDYPPSVNNLYVTTKSGKKCLSKRHVKFRNQLYFDAVEQCGRVIKPITGDAKLIVLLSPPDNRVRDVDNALKSLFDGIKKARMINDDSQIKTLYVRMLAKKRGGSCSVKIKAIRA